MVYIDNPKESEKKIPHTELISKFQQVLRTQDQYTENNYISIY